MERTTQDVLLQASTQAAVIVTDLLGKITVFNAGAENMLGYTTKEVIETQTLLLFHDPEEMAAQQKLLSTILRKPVDEHGA